MLTLVPIAARRRRRIGAAVVVWGGGGALARAVVRYWCGGGVVMSWQWGWALPFDFPHMSRDKYIICLLNNGMFHVPN